MVWLAGMVRPELSTVTTSFPSQIPLSQTCCEHAGWGGARSVRSLPPLIPEEAHAEGALVTPGDTVHCSMGE